MTAPTQPAAENIRPNMVVKVKGKVDYAHTSRLLEGDALVNFNARSRSMYPTETPHTFIRLSHVEIVQEDPAQISWEEAYVQSQFYDFKKNPDKGRGFTAENRTQNLPTLLARDPENPGAYRQIVQPAGEIAQGTEVIIMVKSFESKDKNGNVRPKKGLGLELILVEAEEVPYANSGGARSLDLGAHGIVVSGPLVATQASHSTGEEAAPAAPVGPPPANIAPQAPAAPAQPVAPQMPQAPAQPAAPQAPQAPAQPEPIVPPSPAYQTGPVTDPFAGQPAPGWGGQGITPPA